MIEFNYELRGFDLYKRMLRETPDDIVRGLPVLTREAGESTVSYARYLMGLPKSGTPRLSKDGTRTIIGSAPGEAPAIDTGALYTGLNYAQRRFRDGANVTVNKYEPTDYGIYLEEPLDPTRQRPFMEPAWEHASEIFYQGVVALIARASV